MAADAVSELPDLTEVSLNELVSLPLPAALQAVLERVVAAADQPEEIVAGFQSAI